MTFPADRIPSEPGEARLLGLYPQRQDGLWMQRVKVLGGALSPEQWRGLAEIARRHTPGTPLHLTTRQDVELHNLTAGRVPAVQRGIADVGLTCVGACGDTLRNLTVCPCSGAAAGRVDLFPVAWAIRRRLEAEEGIASLPRKFKIALACGEGCGQPWINDLGLVAAQRDGAWGFRAIGAGSLGAKPATGIELLEWLPAADVLPLAVAAIRVFSEHGDRENRRRARLRHARERVGDEAFAALLRKALDDAKGEGGWPPVELHERRDGFGAALTLTFANGDVTPNQAEALGDLGSREGLCVRVAPHHRVVVWGRGDASVREGVGQHADLAGAARPQPAVVACPGTRWCSRGLVDTRAMADRVRAELGAALPATATVCISGCPNGCSHPAVADFGLLGCVGTREGERGDAYHLVVGGGLGREGRLAERIGVKLSPDEAIAAILELTASEAVR